jgi:hypothetical protein
MSPKKLLTRANAALFLLAVILTVAAGFLAANIIRRASAMRASITTSADVADATRGMRTEPVVRLEGRAAGNRYVAQVLRSIGGTDFRGTGTRLEFVVDPRATFAMGAASDLKPGAVAQVRGTLDDAHRLHADRIVLLTRVVRVTQGRE